MRWSSEQNIRTPRSGASLFPVISRAPWNCSTSRSQKICWNKAANLRNLLCARSRVAWWCSSGAPIRSCRSVASACIRFLSCARFEAYSRTVKTTSIVLATRVAVSPVQLECRAHAETWTTRMFTKERHNSAYRIIGDGEGWDQPLKTKKYAE